MSTIADPDVYDILCSLWALGYILADLQMMFELCLTVRMRAGAGHLEVFAARIRKFFSNSFYLYRFFSHFAYLSGVLLEYAGYQYKMKYDAQDLLDEGCDLFAAHTYRVKSFIFNLYKIIEF